MIKTPTREEPPTKFDSITQTDEPGSDEKSEQEVYVFVPDVDTQSNIEHDATEVDDAQAERT